MVNIAAAKSLSPTWQQLNCSLTEKVTCLFSQREVWWLSGRIRKAPEGREPAPLLSQLQAPGAGCWLLAPGFGA